MGDERGDLGIGAPLTRRRAIGMGLTIASGALAAGSDRPSFAAPPRQATPMAGATSDPAEAIVSIVQEKMAQRDLKAVIVRVTIDGEEVVTAALGESMSGVPATPEMHFRNGAVAITYMATLLLRLVDQGVVTLDDRLATWLPDLPDADAVTLRMLANMTAGYPDFVPNPEFQAAFYTDPFRQWTPDELIEIGLSTPRAFPPGANFSYSHVNYFILGRAMEQITGQPLDVALREQVLEPMGLRNTVSWSTPEIPTPVLHAFSSERRGVLGIAPGVRFYEESTFWNPSWTLARGAIQTTNIDDMAATAVAFGEGTILSPESHAAQVDPMLVGFGAPLEGCQACRTLTEAYAFGLGVVLSGPWILENPLLAGYGSVAAYLPGRKIAIAAVTTFGEGSFDEEGNLVAGRASWEIFAAIAAMLAPEDAPAATRS